MATILPPLLITPAIQTARPMRLMAAFSFVRFATSLRARNSPTITTFTTAILTILHHVTARRDTAGERCLRTGKGRKRRAQAKRESKEQDDGRPARRQRYYQFG